MQAEVKQVVVEPKKGMYIKYFKRPMDFILSLGAIIILSPVLLAVGILVRIKLGSPVIFKQNRSGKNGKKFIMYKFRSMTNETDKQGNLLPDADRLSYFGRILRKTSIDELPELINILKGEMSIVGPRPYPISYLPLYNEIQIHRLDEVPGLTGLAQISGRNKQTWEEKFEKDLEYNRNITFYKDLSIILKTAYKVIKLADINEDGKETASDFMGNN